MPYNPKGFNDVGGEATMAPSELQPPLNFADGGAVNWAGDSTVYNTQSQIGNMMATPGGFGSMASQFTTSAPFASDQNPFSGYQDPNQMQGQGEDQGQNFDFNLGTILQPMPAVPPPANPTVGSFSSDEYNSVSPPLSGGNTIPPAMEMPAPEAAMAKGGNVSNLISRLKDEFSKRGLDFDRAMARRLANKGQNGDTMLAHINPEEAMMLKKSGGSGSVNPDTGLAEFYRSGGDSSYDSSTDSFRENTSAENYARDSQARTGSSDDRGDRGDRSVSAPSPAAARAAENASMEALKDVMATSPSSLMSTGMRDALSRANFQSDVMNRERAAQNAAQENYDTQRELALSGMKNLPNESFILDQSPVVAAKIAADLAQKSQPKMTGFEPPTGPTTTFNKNESGIVPAGVWQSSPFDAYSQVVNVPRPIDPFYSQLQNVNDKLAKLRAEGEQIKQTQEAAAQPAAPAPAPAPKSPFSAYENAVVRGTRSPFESVLNSVTKPAMSDATADSIINTARQTSGLKRDDVYNYTPPSVLDAFSNPAPVTNVAAAPAVESVSPVVAAPAGSSVVSPVAAATTAAAPAATAPAAPAATAPAQKGVLNQIMSGIDAMNAKRIAELEQAKKFAGGNKEQVAEALGVDPSALKSRIVTENGQQKVDYYTKGLDEALAEMVTGPFKAIGNLLSPDVNKIPRGSYVRDPRFSDMFSQNVPSTGYGPYGNLTAEEYRREYGGRDRDVGAGAPVTTPTVPVTPTPEPETPLASFKRKYIPLADYSQYGYGPEGSFYDYAAAKGGHISPLSKKRK